MKTIDLQELRATKIKRLKVVVHLEDGTSTEPKYIRDIQQFSDEQISAVFAEYEKAAKRFGAQNNQEANIDWSYIA